MCYIDLDPCTVWQESERTARKDYKCASCDGKIAVGERHTYHFSIHEGVANFSRCCAPCQTARAQFGAAHGTTPTPDYFVECLESCIDEGDEESRVKWAPMLATIRERAGVRE